MIILSIWTWRKHAINAQSFTFEAKQNKLGKKNKGQVTRNVLM